MKIFLHIGDSRTGTTSLQTRLTKNRDVLEKYDIIYPQIGLLGNGNGVAQHALAFSLMNNWPSFASSAKIEREIVWNNLEHCINKFKETKKSILISSEGFSPIREPKIQFIQDFFSGHDVQVLFTYRNAEDWRRSMREHRIKCGEHVPKPNHPATDFGKNRLERWRKFFDVEVFQYSETCHEEILYFIGLPPEKIPATERHNQKAHPKITELLNELNSIEMNPVNRARFNAKIYNWSRNLND